MGEGQSVIGFVMLPYAIAGISVLSCLSLCVFMIGTGGGTLAGLPQDKAMIIGAALSLCCVFVLAVFWVVGPTTAPSPPVVKQTGS